MNDVKFLNLAYDRIIKETVETFGDDKNNWPASAIEAMEGINSLIARYRGKDPIQLWRWYDAPEGLRDIARIGGDEDWVAIIPPHMADDIPTWMEGGRSEFAVCCETIKEHPTKPGYLIVVGAHA